MTDTAEAQIPERWKHVYRNHVAGPGLDECIEQLGKAEAENRELRARNDWVSVEERLPEKHVYVLWATSGGTVEGYYDPFPNGMQFWRMTRNPSTPRSFKDVTHWMPLPKEPKA